MTNPEMTGEQQYLTNLNLDQLIAHLQAMKAAGANCEVPILVDAFRAPTTWADQRPEFPRAEWCGTGRVSFTQGSQGLPALTVIMDRG